MYKKHMKVKLGICADFFLSEFAFCGQLPNEPFFAADTLVFVVGVRGEILGFVQDELLRKHLPKDVSISIKNVGWGIEDIDRLVNSFENETSACYIATLCTQTPQANTNTGNFHVYSNSFSIFSINDCTQSIFQNF